MNSLTPRGNYLIVKIGTALMLLLCILWLFLPTVGIKADYAGGTLSAYISTFDWIFGNHEAEVTLQAEGSSDVIGKINVIDALFTGAPSKILSVLMPVLLIAVPVLVLLGTLWRKASFKKMPSSKRFYYERYLKFEIPYRVLALIPACSVGILLGWALTTGSLASVAWDRTLIFLIPLLAVGATVTVFEKKTVKQLSELESLGNVAYQELLEVFPYAAQGKGTLDLAVSIFESRYGADWAQQLGCEAQAPEMKAQNASEQENL